MLSDEIELGAFGGIAKAIILRIRLLIGDRGAQGAMPPLEAADRSFQNSLSQLIRRPAFRLNSARLLKGQGRAGVRVTSSAITPMEALSINTEASGAHFVVSS